MYTQGKFPFIYSETGKDLLAKGHLMRHRHIRIAELTEVRPGEDLVTRVI